MKKQDAKQHRPGLQRGFDSLTENAESAKVNEVIKRLTGKKTSSSLDESETDLPKPTTVENTAVKITALRHHLGRV